MAKKIVVRVNAHLDNQMNAILKRLEKETNEKLGKAAQKIAEEAKGSAAFSDYKYTTREPASAQTKRKGRPKNLRKAITWYWNEKTASWFVRAAAPHAHLVEFGHLIVTEKGKVVGSVAPHPFLRPAAEKVIRKLKSSFGV